MTQTKQPVRHPRRCRRLGDSDDSQRPYGEVEQEAPMGVQVKLATAEMMNLAVQGHCQSHFDLSKQGEASITPLLVDLPMRSPATADRGGPLLVSNICT